MDAASRTPVARFVTGSTMRHVIVMTMTSSVGLMALFLVDLASLFFLNLLGRTEITAAVGYAGTISFINLSLSLGLGIAASALVSRSLGAREVEKARRYATSALAARPMPRRVMIRESPRASCTVTSSLSAELWPGSLDLFERPIVEVESEVARSKHL